MPSPFPGMDPFLEDPAFWEGFHDVLITVCMFELEQALPDGYISNVKERAHVISSDDAAAKVYVPDLGLSQGTPVLRPKPREDAGSGGLAVEIEPVTIASFDDFIEVREAYLEIQKLPDYELVTVIEMMSPSNKYGSGIELYHAKRASLVSQGVHVVELDLLRGGARTKLVQPLPSGDYYAMVFRADRRPDVDVFAWKLRDKLPKIPIPLRKPDQDVALSLSAVVTTAYDRGRYDRKLRYQRPLDPPVATADVDWVAGRLGIAAK